MKTNVQKYIALVTNINTLNIYECDKF